VVEPLFPKRHETDLAREVTYGGSVIVDGQDQEVYAKTQLFPVGG
jgi:hypothetical protein